MEKKRNEELKKAYTSMGIISTELKKIMDNLKTVEKLGLSAENEEKVEKMLNVLQDFNFSDLKEKLIELKRGL